MSGDDNEQILNDIQKLQNIEKDLFGSLENPNIEPEASKKIIGKINDVSQMRLNLYKLLNNLNSNYKNSLTNSREVLTEQNTAIEIVETELNRSKQRLALLEEEKNNKIRLIEINTYYGQSYDEHANMMKLFIYILIPIICLSLLFKYEVIPSSIYTILNVTIVLIGIILLWRNYSMIYMHDKLNYPEYDWTFNASTAPPPDTSASASTSADPWKKMKMDCIGRECCISGTVYDSGLNKCVSTTNKLESFINMDQLNDVFTKHTSKFKKPDITMNSKIYPYPKNY